MKNKKLVKKVKAIECWLSKVHDDFGEMNDNTKKQKIKTKKLVKKVKAIECWLSEVTNKYHELLESYSDHIIDYHTPEETKETSLIQNAEEEK